MAIDSAIKTIKSIKRTLSRLGFVHKSRKKGVPEREITFTHIVLEENTGTIWIWIDANKLPRGVRVTDLYSEETITELQQSLSNPSIRIEELYGLKWLCFDTGEQRHKFPRVFKGFQFSDNAKPLSIPLGIDKQGKHIALSLKECLHLLVAGTSGGGKTTFVHNAILSLLERDECVLYLLDPKRVDLSLYRGIESTTVETDIIKMVGILQSIHELMLQRQSEQETHRCVNADTLEKSKGITQKPIIVVVEELATLLNSKKKIGKQTISQLSEDLIIELIRLGRATRIHLVLVTQNPDAETITGAIKANLTHRIAFNCTDRFKSAVIIESSRATGIPRGRAILRSDDGLTEVQTELVEETDIKRRLRLLGQRFELEESILEIFRVSKDRYGFSANYSILEKDPHLKTLFLRKNLRYAVEWCRENGLAYPTNPKNNHPNWLFDRQLAEKLASAMEFPYSEEENP